MGLLPLLRTDPFAFGVLIVLLLFSVIAHELAHGWTAYFFGDDTAAERGRLSMNPLSHIAPIGALMLIVAGFGWAKPVPVDFRRLTHGRIAVFCVALAGCVVNLLIAVIGVGLIVLTPLKDFRLAAGIVVVLIQINILLAAFNLIPIPPLDGSKVLMSFLPLRLQIAMSRVEPFGFVILLLLLFQGTLTPLLKMIEGAIYAAFSLLF